MMKSAPLREKLEMQLALGDIEPNNESMETKSRKSLHRECDMQWRLVKDLNNCHGSFDVIVGMDWLSQHKAVIVCHEKVVEIPVEDGRILKVHEEHAVGITKALKSAKEDEPKLSYIFVVCEFEDVFPEDLSGLPPQRQVQFHIDLVPGVTPVAKSPYRLAPSKMQELSRQLQELQDKGFIRPSHFAMGSASVICQEKGWFATMENLYAKFSKWSSWLQEGALSGSVINQNGLYTVDSSKIEPQKESEEYWEDFVVYCDASNQGLGCVLMQRGKVIAYASRQLKTYEKKLYALGLELGAVVFAIKTLEDYLYGY
ncbi:putative reverse transcriptase domain-containing protein [Tanacetum coccineum]